MLLLRIHHLKKMKLSKKMIDFANLVEEIDKTNKTNQNQYVQKQKKTFENHLKSFETIKNH